MKLRLPLLLLVLSLARPVLAASPRPDRVLLLVFDQMRPDYIDRYDLPHFKQLRAASTNYPNALVGHIAAETIVSHEVISTGLPPRDLPWQDEVFHDVRGLLGPAGAFHATGALGSEKLLTLLRTVPKQASLPWLIKQKRPGLVAAVGEKDYATTAFGGPQADMLVTLSKHDGICTVGGVAVPAYIRDNERFTLECAKTYGTARSFYPLDGSRFVPGDDPRHEGGDAWVTDAALALMAHEDWSALLLTFGGIDKIGHQSGEADGPMPLDFEPKYRLADALRIADAQLGRLMEELARRGLRERTLIVVTADHGAQSNTRYFGMGHSAKPIAAHGGEADVPNFWLQHLQASAKVAASFQDSAIRVWLADLSAENRAAALSTLRTVSGVTEVFVKEQQGGRWSYRQVYDVLAAKPPRFAAWARAHSAALVGSMACEGSADLVALLADGVGFDLLGDHGGAQEVVQRIPLMVLDPSARPRSDPRPLVLAQVRDLVMQALEGGPRKGR